ncbi:hypothetical protein MW887_002648 [Aspergillus wentii]|nr:hypothetical protein MW887_002648 [Aspergillus wentii]
MKISIATNSLGKSSSGHSILHKLSVAKSHHFDGVEVAFECLEHHALTTYPKLTRENQLRSAARDVHNTASSLSLQLIALNPFGAYDGLVDEGEVERRLDEARVWCELCEIMGIEFFQITTCLYPMDSTRITSNPTIIARNMRKLTLLAQNYNLTIAYEAPAWGIHLNTWQQTHQIIQMVNLPNLKHCLDTFHISTKLACDPFNATSPIKPTGMDNFTTSLTEMKQTLQPSDIAYFQLSDATVADPAQRGYPRKDLAQPAYMTQSRNCRIFPCEEAYGGILPAVDVARAVFDLGYEGWVSMEVFYTELWEEREE